MQMQCLLHSENYNAHSDQFSRPSLQDYLPSTNKTEGPNLPNFSETLYVRLLNYVTKAKKTFRLTKNTQTTLFCRHYNAKFKRI